MKEMNNNTETTVINYVNFNQTGSCISVGTSIGLDIFCCDPFGKFYSERKLHEGGYSIVEMLFNTSLVVLVGNGDSPTLSPRKLQLINTKKRSVICEITFPTAIVSIKMNRLRLVILLKNQIYIYDITSMKLLHVIENDLNLYGLITVSSSLENNYLVYPNPSQVINSDIRNNATTNNITIPSLDNIDFDNSNHSNTRKITDNTSTKDNATNFNSTSNNNVNNIYSNSTGNNNNNNNSLNNTNSNGTQNMANNMNINPDTIVNNGDVIIFDLNNLRPTLVIEAHKNNIACIALSSDGRYLATASEKGTIIRIFSVETGIKLYQFRRGTYPTRIFSMNFSKDNQFLTVCCSTKTVHIFKLNNKNKLNGVVDNNSDIDDEESIGMDENNNNYYDNNNNNSTSNNSAVKTKEPYVDASRKTVARMIRTSSQNLTRNVAMTLGQLFPIKVESILEPSRHFASLKLPIENDKLIKCTASIGEYIELDTRDFPELLSSQKEESEFASNTTNRISDSKLTKIKVLSINVITTEGFLYNYVMDPERGGDCLLLRQYSLIVD